MILAGFCVIALFLMVISRELDNTRLGQASHILQVRRTPAPTPTVLRPQPPLAFTGTANPSSTVMPQNDIYRLSNHYVFPPVQTLHPSHRRSKAMSQMMEEGEMLDFIG